MGDPMVALSGFYWMAMRRRVRGWSQLMVAASRAPLNYARWIQRGEVRAFAEFRRLNGRRDTPFVIVLLLGANSAAEPVDRTVTSIRKALGSPLIYSLGAHDSGLQPLPSSDTLIGALSAVAQLHSRAWLLPISAGDEVSPELCDILGRSIGPDENGLIYWDEDQVGAEGRCAPWVKPDWDPLLFGRLGGLVGASVVALRIIERVANAFADAPITKASVERLLLDLAATGTPEHIPLILTHRGGPSPTRERLSPGPQPPGSWPTVSMIIPTKDKPELLSACLNGVERTDYPGQVQIIVVDNASRDPTALELLHRTSKNSNVIVLADDGPFNFSRLINLGATVAKGELLCLMNNDVEPIDSDWLATLVAYAAHDGVGAVGAQLLYPSGRIQHAGVAIGLGGAAGHVQKGVDPAECGFWTWHAATREVSAVTAAVLLVKRRAFVDVGGFDEEFAVAFNDVDFCLRLKHRGFRNLYVAEARLLHRESESRGQDRSPAQARRFAGEVARLQERWGTETYNDPHFSCLFSRLVERCVLAP